MPVLEMTVATRHLGYMAMRVIFVTWAAETYRNQKNDLENQVKAMRRVLGKKAESIWMMTKAELVTLAEK